MAITSANPTANAGVEARPAERIHQLAAKVYIDAPDKLVPRDFVDVFHEWIRTDALPELLIDVTDYSHVQHGPGVMLIGHEGHYSIDDIDGRLGLSYWFKRDEPGPLETKLRAGLQRTLRAAALLENHPTLAHTLRFRGDECRITLASRLLAPNTAATVEATAPVVEQLLAKLTDSTEPTVAPDPDQSRPFAIQTKTTTNHRAAQLLARL